MQSNKREMYLQAEAFLTISDFQSVEKNFKNISEKYLQIESKFCELKNHLEKFSINIPNN